MDWKRGEVASRIVTFEMNSLSRGAECSVASVPLLPWVLVSKLTGLRPLPPTPKREVLRITIERGLRRFITLALRRTLKPRSFMSATPQTSSKTILRL